MGKISEKRSLIRKPLPKQVQFEIRCINPETWESVSGQGGMVDINHKGIGLITKLPLQAGEILKISLPGTIKGVSFPVFSEVRWIARDGDSFRAGVQFLG
ncbi:MAG: PilZ domain-containing protein [Thermodesulfobacteriota bacterium]